MRICVWIPIPTSKQGVVHTPVTPALEEQRQMNLRCQSAKVANFRFRESSRGRYLKPTHGLYTCVHKDKHTHRSSTGTHHHHQKRVFYSISIKIQDLNTEY